MTAYNIVRFRVKAGMEKTFVEANETMLKELPGMDGAIDAALVKTGDHTFCFIGKWKSFDNIVASRTEMVATLDQFRHMLEDLGGGLGVTDAVSGTAVVEKKA